MDTNINNRTKHKYKVLLIGDSQVGKTVFFQKVFPEEATKHHLSTIGVQFNSKNIKYEGKLVQLEIWDTAGQERYRAITKNFFKGANGILLFYDITNRESFVNIKKWLKLIKDTLSLDTLSLVLVGNKIDLDSQGLRVIENREGVILADALDGKFIEISGKIGKNINESIMLLVQLLISKNDLNQQTNDKSLFITNRKTKGKINCC